MFPHEQIPDGAVFAPHHYIYALGLVLLVVLIVWDNYPTRYRLAAVFFSLVALDDAVEHAFGWWTPLDYAPDTRSIKTVGIDSTGNAGIVMDVTVNYGDGTSETFTQSKPYSGGSWTLTKAVDSIDWQGIEDNEVYLIAKAPELKL